MTILQKLVWGIRDSYNQKMKMIRKLIMEMGNMLKRQKPDQRAEKNRRPPMGLQHREKISHPEAECINLESNLHGHRWSDLKGLTPVNACAVMNGKNLTLIFTKRY